MYIPGLLERVRLAGLGEVYLVTQVDHQTQVADLLPIVWGQNHLPSIPFIAIESIPGCGPPEGLEFRDAWHRCANTPIESGSAND